ncbi:MAG: hypothetical protein KF788_18200 [Piscinibacter sp.]|nr:hypothetical protein [Piscinibacter sp.]
MMVLASAAALLCPFLPARSQTVTATPTPNERLMSLVPEKIGDWTLDSLRGARPGPDGVTDPAAEAEFRKGDLRASLTVSQSARRVTPPASPTENTTPEGTERIYAEGNAALREAVRRADGRVDVALMRADGIVVTVQATMVAVHDLKTLALGIKPLPR